MPEAKRIIMVSYSGERGPVEVVRAYINQHRLPWRLQVIAIGFWQSNSQGWADDFDGLIGWIGYSVPPWWKHHPKPAAVAFGRHEGIGVGVHGTLVKSDDAAIGAMAARHYRDQGFRHVATVSHWNQPVRVRRFTAFAEEATRLGLQMHRLECDRGLAQDDAEQQLITELAQAPHPLGIFLHQDRDAQFMNDLCDRLGLQVPEHVALLGVDNAEYCNAAVPSLSSVDINRPAMARQMILHLHRQMSGEQRENEVVLVPPLRVHERESTQLLLSGDALVDEVRLHIGKNPGASNRVTELAKRVHLSPSQLRRRFMDACGFPPSDYVRQCRIRLAQELLLASDDCLDDIARRCGLSSRGSLWQLFKSADLQTPEAWRHR